ncbi:Acyltransferase family protein [Pseudodesulfovibrio hydrargyri]|uniref:Acyltransferase family protein n=1 Tax=Pseudodesulfovibrio hydrargyri TaxID=2125990 RepID=A0A1J5N2H1_9BACT|nr:acyltransferase family protein [Pseudodesulfovibrio hydrargyri]OIQ49000.1 Acyltransferase family protein [Pseudodesulfovibrio hydrargyri]
MTGEARSGGRIPMLDVARFLGMFLVYYGHAVERIMYLQSPAATAQYKFIYSFHMPFFFLLAGFTLAPEKARLPAGRFLKRLAASRLVPYAAFSALLLGLSLLFAGHFPLLDLPKGEAYLKGLWYTLLGFPLFNIPLWFLAALVAVELIHFAVGRFLDSTLKIVVTALACYVGGYYLTLHVTLLPGPTYWLIPEAPVSYAFYLVGVLMRRKSVFIGGQPRWRFLAGAGLCLLGVVLTFDLNQGPFRLFQAVVIVASGHGNVLLFPLTALAGSLFLLLVARSAGANRFLMFLGKNVLILFCLNGVFYHYFNGPFADWYVATFPDHWAAVTAVTFGFTVLSLTACLPAIWLLKRYLPQLVGKPRAKGPLLPRLVS